MSKRYALIIAGGAGTRLWPMSTQRQPKQLIPLIEGRSLLEIAMRRLEGLIPADQVYVCAGQAHRQAMLERLPGLSEQRFIGEPMGRDTLNAVGLGTAVLGRADAGATVAVFTADHLIEPEDRFREVVQRGYELAEADATALVTFGIEPTYPATGYGYLELGEAIEGAKGYVVDRFKEKPDRATAEHYVEAGPRRYLWNSGMFVWQARALLGCIEKYAPANHAGLMRCAAAWGTDQQERVLEAEYGKLNKVSVDYAVMEPASQDPTVRVAAVPMPLRWLDVGSWPSYAETLEADADGNATGQGRSLMLGSANTLAVSDDPEHLIAAVGVKDLIIIRTERATLVCHKDEAERIKELHKQVGERFGEELL